MLASLITWFNFISILWEKKWKVGCR